MTFQRAINSRGFTLVETLVVVAILAVLAGISYPIILRQVLRGEETEALNMMRSLEMALDDYAGDQHGFLPVPTAGIDPVNDDGVNTLNEPIVVATLLGLDPFANPININGALVGKEYFKAKRAEEGKNGLLTAAGADSSTSLVGLADPWGRGYGIYLDYDANGEVDVSISTNNPFTFSDVPINSSTGGVVNKRFAIWTLGGEIEVDDDDPSVVVEAPRVLATW